MADVDFTAFSLPATGAADGSGFWLQHEEPQGWRIAIPETPHAVSIEAAKSFMFELAHVISLADALAAKERGGRVSAVQTADAMRWVYQQLAGPEGTGRG